MLHQQRDRCFERRDSDCRYQPVSMDWVFHPLQVPQKPLFPYKWELIINMNFADLASVQYTATTI